MGRDAGICSEQRVPVYSSRVVYVGPFPARISESVRERIVSEDSDKGI